MTEMIKIFCLRCSFLMVALLIAGMVCAQGSKGKTGLFAFTNAKIYTVTNGVIEGGTLIVKDGKIEAVGSGIAIPEGAEVIECAGQHIYPGMIDGGTKLGLSEISSIARTTDFSEIGDVVPQMKALTAVNPNSVLIPVTRLSGVTTVIAIPSGGLLPGTAALINLYGYSPKQMFAGFEAVVLEFPSTGRRGRWDRRSEEEIKSASDKALKQLDDTWKKVAEYHKVDSAITAQKVKDQKLDFYPELEALLPAYRGEAKIMVEVNRAEDIRKAIEWVTENNVKAIFTGVLEGWRVTEELVAANIPVIAGPVLTLPAREYDRYDRPYANPGLMHEAGIKVALKTTEAENVRNLPYHAGFAATYGLGKEEALKSVTITAAEIFGVSDRLGSIEPGKEATFFVSDGDPFETKTQINQVVIGGWLVPMESRQTRLYDEFLERAPGLDK